MTKICRRKKKEKKRTIKDGSDNWIYLYASLDTILQQKHYDHGKQEYHTTRKTEPKPDTHPWGQVCLKLLYFPKKMQSSILEKKVSRASWPKPCYIINESCTVPLYWKSQYAPAYKEIPGELLWLMQACMHIHKHAYISAICLLAYVQKKAENRTEIQQYQ